MTAVWMRFQAQLRSGYRIWLAMAVLAGLAGGVVLAAVAGARRTDSALTRHLVAYRFPDVKASVPDDLHDTVRALPEVAAASESFQLAYVARDARNRPVVIFGPRALVVEVSADGQDGVALARWKLLAGRAPDPSRRNEALVDSRAAKTFGVQPGDTVPLRVYPRGATISFRGDPRRMRAGQLVELRVVGVKAATDTVDHPGGVVRLTPAFYRAHGLERYALALTGSSLWLRLKHGAADLPAFRARVDRLVPGASSGLDLQSQWTGRIQRSIHLQVQALRLAAAFGGLLAFVLLFQALVRLAALAAFEHPTLRAIGMTRQQLLGLGLARAGAIALLAASLSVGVAAVLSPLMPIGLARELEPDPGFMLDPLVLGLGAIGVMIAVLLAGAVAARRAGRSPEGTPSAFELRGSAAADALARWRLPASVVTGVRFALARGRGATGVPVGATLLGAVLAVAVAATALTFSASLGHLFSTPRLFGQTWDYEVRYGNSFDLQQITVAARADHSIGALAFGTSEGSLQVSRKGRSRRVSVRAMSDLKGRLPPVVLEGRAPRGTHEILLGTKLLDALDAKLGDSITARSERTARLRVVGRGVVAAGRTSNPGEGAGMTWEALRRLTPGIPTDCCAQAQVRFAPRADRDATFARLQHEYLDAYPTLPRAVADFGGIDEMPLVLSALLVAMAAATLAHTLLTAIRRRRRDLGILKTLGFDRRQVMATFAWQATTFAAVGLVVGLPLGVAAGRWAWNLFADELGVVPEPATPLPLILLVVPGAILLANLVAAVPARIAAATRPALVLRAE